MTGLFVAISFAGGIDSPAAASYIRLRRSGRSAALNAKSQREPQGAALLNQPQSAASVRKDSGHHVVSSGESDRIAGRLARPYHESVRARPDPALPDRRL